MKFAPNNYSDISSETEYGLGSYAGGLSLDGIGSELRALYDEVTDFETPKDLVELAEKVEVLAAKSVAKA